MGSNIAKCDQPSVRLVAVGGDSRYHYAHYDLDCVGMTVRISVEVEGPAPASSLTTECRNLLQRLAELALDAARKLDGIHWPDQVKATSEPNQFGGYFRRVKRRAPDDGK